ncbi:RICIN domain-containing protein [Fulvivirga sediminis]|uniref:RICIN domain-containing protein n=1 Tax=Fulvivirga sediminis TaxID=2803949 RepID=A0A937FEJ2_9BACT|nr:RICIN domain-containing protein [Fulvivirga sediminis]MBL3658938.1 RICIN domain-containing protein [Fulvivirga sediminis]
MKRPILLVFLCILFSIVFHSNSSTAQTSNVYIGSTDQTIRGFGGMNFPRWISDLTPDQADKAFGNGYGQIGLSILRISVSPQSNQWSLEVPTAQRAANHGAIVFATPWSPPASMKTNGSTIKGELRTNQYGAYANYLRDFTNYMSSNGVSLYAMSIQNEPDWLPEYESCGWNPSQMRTFLDNNASVIPTRVIAPETVNYKSNYMSGIASSSQVDILANHAYGGTPVRYNSSKEQWMTEHYAPNSNSNSANNWPEALEAGKEIHDYLINGYNAYIWWYIRRSYGLITENGSVSKRGFVMSHYAKFVRPGFVRVRADASPTSGVSVSAYQNGNTIVVVAINQNSSSRNLTLNFAGNSVNNITKWETTGTVGNNVTEGATYSGGTSFTNTLTGYSITTFRGTLDGNTPGGPSTNIYQIKNRGTGMFLDGLGYTTNGDPCVQWANTTHPNSQWEFITNADGYTQLKNVSSGMFIDGLGLTENASEAGLWANTTHPNSQWSVEQYDGSYYRIRNRATGLYLDGLGRTTDGDACGQYANTSSVNAQWQLISVSGTSLAKEASIATENSEFPTSFYPNPVDDQLQINTKESDLPVFVKIYDMSGKIRLEKTLSDSQNKVDVQKLPSGVYILEMAHGNETKRSQLIKK